MFGSLLGVVTDVVKVAIAPAVTKPVADMAEEAVKEVKQSTNVGQKP